MKLSLDAFFKKHSHLKITRVAEQAGIPYQRLTEVRSGAKSLTDDMADAINKAIKSLSETQIKDTIKP